ncbi:ISAzo13 family transposase [Actinocrinis puniceicyclus]|uniref:ISAzo13 family transposase n=1 Tax=Actinocrinis puniceicyclus TaxID=977794 RepID=A0A8J8BGG6_9ACTN|nr:ISAzo13 family transposase [Actinocrinis puniceicyclus]
MEIDERVLAAKFEAILPHLDERQRRLVLAAEARSLGHGGISLVARASGVSRVTITAGVGDLESGRDPMPGRSRRPGAGRKPLTETDPGLLGALDALVDPVTRGDPMSRLRWTTKSTRSLADELGALGHRVSHHSVGRLLSDLDYSLQGNAKTVEGTQHPDRDAQFRYINGKVTAHLADGDPVISVDAKKKELIGEYANTGRDWRPAGAPRRVQVHDFPGPAGKAVPYGVYDLAADAGWVSVGCDGDTAQFAVATIRRWWHTVGATAYPQAKRLLITADAGGSNGYRLRLWKKELADLATETGLTITVCHMPPGTSKWNKVEHRLFSHISMNWAGQPLTSHEVAVNLIAGTTTRSGLSVQAELDPGSYPRGIKISDREMRLLKERHVRPHEFHGEWNYDLIATEPPE